MVGISRAPGCSSDGEACSARTVTLPPALQCRVSLYCFLSDGALGESEAPQIVHAGKEETGDCGWVYTTLKDVGTQAEQFVTLTALLICCAEHIITCSWSVSLS